MMRSLPDRLLHKLLPNRLSKRRTEKRMRVETRGQRRAPEHLPRRREARAAGKARQEERGARKERKAKQWRPCWPRRIWSSRARLSTTRAVTVPHSCSPLSSLSTHTSRTPRKTFNAFNSPADSCRSQVRARNRHPLNRGLVWNNEEAIGCESCHVLGAPHDMNHCSSRVV